MIAATEIRPGDVLHRVERRASDGELVARAVDGFGFPLFPADRWPTEPTVGLWVARSQIGGAS